MVDVRLPFDLQHKIHVDFDSETGFVGLPPDWESKLASSGVSKQSVIDHPAEVFECIKFQVNAEIDPHSDIGCMNTSKPPPTKGVFYFFLCFFLPLSLFFKKIFVIFLSFSIFIFFFL